MATKIGTQYRRVPTSGTKVAIVRGMLSRKLFYRPDSPYMRISSELRNALRNGQLVTAVSADNSQSTGDGTVHSFAINGITIQGQGAIALPVRDLFRLA